jgi:transposase
VQGLGPKNSSIGGVIIKSTDISRQNQRLQRISPTTAVVGVDIGKFQHVAHVTDFRGLVLTRRPLHFTNTGAGFESLVAHICQVQRAHKLDHVIVGMESTGHYFWNLAYWLRERQVDVVIVNPMTTKRNKENRDNTPSKSDAKDALVIADVVSRGYYTPFTGEAAVFAQLRLLVRNREHWVVDATRIKNRITRWMDIRFPEYTTVFDDLFGVRSLATLRLFPTPSDLVGRTPDQLIAAWAPYMRRPGGQRGRRTVTLLLHQTHHSVGLTVGLAEDRWELQQLLAAYDRLQDTRAEADQRIEVLMDQVPYVAHVRSVGMPAPDTAAIVALAGDLRQYTHGNQLLCKAGLNLAERRSGQYIGKVRLSKRGNALLRKHLLHAVLYLIANIRRSRPGIRTMWRSNT